MKIGIVVFDGVTELDFIGPWQVFKATGELTGKVETMLVAERLDPVRASKGLRFHPERTLAEAPPLDVVVVPGGAGTRREVNNPELTGWLAAVAPKCRYMTSVCTGALLLHGAGLVRGKRVTTYWAFADELEGRGDVTVVRDRRYVRDGNVVTAAGVSAGIDMALWLVGDLFDPELARRVQRIIEYDPAPPYAAEV
jgi:transcriptional regulator GlxA family with amidase domain